MTTLQSPESSAPARTKMVPAPTSIVKQEETRTPGEIKAAQQQYGRGNRIAVKGIKDKKLRGNMKKLEYRYKSAAINAKDAEMLLEEEKGYLEAEGMERTYKFSQQELVKAVDVSTAQKASSVHIPT
jgi:U3 small nucleolar RNA-associated protein 7